MATSVSENRAETWTPKKIIEVLNEVAVLLELKGENPFKIKAYRSGVFCIERYEGDFIQKVLSRELSTVKGLGKGLQEKIYELVETGRLAVHQELRAQFPETLFELFEVQGIGAKKIKVLYEQLGVDSLVTLKAACEAGQVAELPGFAKKSQATLLQKIEQREHYASYHRLGDLAPFAESILIRLKTHSAVLQAALAGSYRRGKEVLHDLDFVVATSDPETVGGFFAEQPEVSEVLVHGKTKVSVQFSLGPLRLLQADLRLVSNEQFVFALQHFTGSKEHNVRLRSWAKKKGLKINEYGLFALEGQTQEQVIQSEDEIYTHLGLTPIPPALREDRGEIEAAQNGRIPKLIKITDLCGTFHNHTMASDGQQTLEEMAQAAQELGLGYLGIADHSKSSVQANGLSEERLLAQINQVRSLNKRFEQEGDSFRLLAGSEVDILKDGSLDFDDSILKQLDYAVASVHQGWTLSEEEMTQRIIRAMENPYIHMIGHLTGRLLLKREAYLVNHQKIIDCAVETRTALELNANPKRLDMDWRWWRGAAEAGVLCAINPDAHHQNQLQYLHYGVQSAQKGWLTKEHVLNTRPLNEVLEWLRKGA